MGLMEEVLNSLLNSLHVYLMHDGDELFRIRTETNDTNVDRFTTQITPAKAKYNVDTFVDYIKEVDDQDEDNERCIQSLAEWLKSEEYDWDAIEADIDNEGFNQHQSNIFLRLSMFNKDTLCGKLHDKFINVYDFNVDAINFGSSVLHWFRYGTASKYKSFEDEILNNKYSEFDNELLEQYKTECALYLHSNEHNGYQWTLWELLCLKLYTDTGKLCSKLRSSFWTNSSLDIKMEFYFWGMNIYKTFLYHSKPLPRLLGRNYPMPLYHGINQVFAVNERSPKYHGPVSTTLTNNVAHSFSHGTGLLWKMEASYDSPFSSIFGIDVSFISRFKNESEILLVDCYLFITRTHNFLSKNHSKKADHLLYQLQIFKNEIIDPNIFWAQIGFYVNRNDVELISIIKKHSLLLSPTQYNKNKTVLHRLVEELKLKQFTDAYTLIFTAELTCVEFFETINCANYRMHFAPSDVVMNETCIKNTKVRLVSTTNDGVHIDADWCENISIYNEEFCCKIYIQNSDICDGKWIPVREKWSNASYLTNSTKLQSEVVEDVIVSITDVNAVHSFIILTNTGHSSSIPSRINMNQLKKDSYPPLNPNEHNEIHLILPYEPNAKSMSVYVKPSQGSTYLLIKTIANMNPVQFDSTVNKVRYIIAVLTQYSLPIVDGDAFWKCIGIVVDGKLLREIKRRSHWLLKPSRYVTYSSNGSIQNIKTLLHRFVEELKFDICYSMYQLLTCSIIIVEPFGVTLHIAENSIASDASYKLQNDFTRENIPIDEDHILYQIKKGKYTLSCCSEQIFDSGTFIPLQRVEFYHDIDSKAFIDNLYINESNCVTLRNIAEISKGVEKSIRRCVFTLKSSEKPKKNKGKEFLTIKTKAFQWVDALDNLSTPSSDDEISEMLDIDDIMKDIDCEHDEKQDDAQCVEDNYSNTILMAQPKLSRQHHVNIADNRTGFSHSSVKVVRVFSGFDDFVIPIRKDRIKYLCQMDLFVESFDDMNSDLKIKTFDFCPTFGEAKQLEEIELKLSRTIAKNPNDDGIIFRCDIDDIVTTIIPTKIRILNYGLCVQKISIFIGSDLNADYIKDIEWNELCKPIDNDCLTMDTEQEHILELLPSARYFLTTKRFNVIKVNICHNAGFPQSAFRKFQLFAMDYSFTEFDYHQIVMSPEALK